MSNFKLTIHIQSLKLTIIQSSMYAIRLRQADFISIFFGFFRVYTIPIDIYDTKSTSLKHDDVMKRSAISFK